MARNTDQSERYEDMMQFLKEIIQDTNGDMFVDVNTYLALVS